METSVMYMSSHFYRAPDVCGILTFTVDAVNLCVTTDGDDCRLYCHVSVLMPGNNQHWMYNTCTDNHVHDMYSLAHVHYVLVQVR